MKKVLKTGVGVWSGSILAVLAVLLAACGPAAPETGGSSPITTASPEPGLGAISGQIPEAVQLWPDEALVIYAVPFYPSQTDPEEGFYVLDTSIHPMTDMAENGGFWINNVQPGNYVLVAGPRAEDSLLVANPDQTPCIFQVTPDQVTTLKDLQLTK